jgi:hypothetical protein
MFHQSKIIQLIEKQEIVKENSDNFAGKTRIDVSLPCK